VDQGQRAVEVVDLVTAVAESLRANRPAGGIICASLARATGAETSAWIAVREGEDLEVLWAHPTGPEADSLVAAAVDHGLGLGKQFLNARAGRLGQIVLLTPDEVPGTGPADTHRVLALAKRKGFTESELELLVACLPALTMMLSAVMAASEQARSVAAQVAAAKKLGLSERELEVLQLLSQGLLATSIASRLALSPRTVHKHLGNIYEKMGVHDRLVAVQLARQHGLVSSPS